MTQIIQTADIENMDRRHRANLFNTLSGYKGVHLIGTANAQEQTNLALFNSVMHIGANPPLLGFIVRPATIARHTYKNIKETGFYTINHVLVDHYEKAHQTSAKYPKGTSEFEACGFEPIYTNTHPAPYVEECSIKIGLEYVEEHLIQANQTILLIGKIIELILPQQAIGLNGHLDLAALDSVAVVGLDTYYKMDKIKQLGYAKPQAGE